jgi:hypothetical protein
MNCNILLYPGFSVPDLLFRYYISIVDKFLSDITYNAIRPLRTHRLIQYLHFISKEELRILLAIEIGMKNHEYVPLELITTIGNLRGGETFKTVKKLLKAKLVVHVGCKCKTLRIM